MTLQELFKSRLLFLPKKIPDEKNYREVVNKMFADYINLLNSLSIKKFQVIGNTSLTNFEMIIQRQQEFIDGIKRSIEFYYDGYPFKAYEEFSKVMSYRVSKFGSMLNVGEFEEQNNFYRIRTKLDNKIYSPNEMFHIPFELRGKVSTQRYSIPGFPSLYLGTTLYIAWEELNRPKLDEFQAVRLENTKPIKYLDLTFSNLNLIVINGKLTKNAYRFLMTWPLIAACSISVKDYSDNFKPEYLIPQFLLQWIRTNKDVDGIKYNSTHIKRNVIKGHLGLCNLVLPVKENKDEGFCTQLTNMFNITETISWQLMEFSMGGMHYISTQEEINELDSKLPKLEIIKGIKSDYSRTSFGKLESQLDGMESFEF